MKPRMPSLLALIGLVVVLAQPVRAEPLPPPPAPAADAMDAPPHDALAPAAEQAMWGEIRHNLAELQRAGARGRSDIAQAVTYAFPLRMAAGQPDYAGFRVSAFADHSPAAGQVLDYNGGARTYDGHRGTDYALWPFPWNKLDAGAVEVIAAAAGTIVAKANINPSDHNCGSASGGSWNYVALTHADGRMTIYGHMGYNSLTSKAVGQTVDQGEYLGAAASSGDSSGPHLHFEVRAAAFSSVWVDPYAGPGSQPESLWADQRPYYDPAINRLATHAAPPSTPDPCQPTVTNLQDRFTTPSTVYLYAYYRDYRSALATQLAIYRPDGSVYQTWQEAPGGNTFASAWSRGWVVNLTAGDPAGTWRFEAAYNGQVYETLFDVEAQLTARGDTAITLVSTPISIDVLSNDAGAAGATLAITAVGAPAHGSVNNTGGKLVYTPAQGFVGADTFSYTVSAGSAHADAAVTVVVAAEIYRLALPLIMR